MAKMDSLRAKGVCVHGAPFPGRVDIAQAKAGFQEGISVSVAGRITAKRIHGKVTFLDIRDASEKIQLYLKDDFLPREKMSIFDDLDIADIIAVKGELFKTRTGEVTLKVQDVSVLTKALRPLPEKWHGLKDVELRYRQRYLDLVANEDVKKVFKARSDIIRAIRKFLDDKGFQEVETPMMHDVPGGAAGRPFKTYHNEFDRELYLRIAPELYLKRLLVGGLDRVYEINRSFRNEGISTRHNPEFTMLEVYWAYADYEAMMTMCEEMFAFIAATTLGSATISYQGKTIHLTPPWQRRSFADMVREKFDISPADTPEVMLKKLQDKGFAKDKQRLSRSQVAKIIEEILGEGMSEAPTFVTDYFTALCPLAKTKKDNPLVSERFELYIAGMEVANAYSELNDPVEQKRRFEEEIRELDTGEAKAVDEDYVTALEHGMPSAGGLGVGIDRLVMLLADQASIRDVILFPLLKPHA
jgi:lysyl-tRNA synthetase class 2